MFFSSWADLGRIALTGFVFYAALVLMLRVSGKRTLAKFNAFDFVVTIAFGSVLATTMLSKDVAVLDGVVALAVLIGAQLLITFGSTHWRWVQRIVKSQPRLLFYRGQFLREALLRERVASEEVRAAVREQGYALLDEIAAVVLETDGTISVIPDLGGGAQGALADVAGAGDLERLEAGGRHEPVAQWERERQPGTPPEAGG